ncbi:MAG: hypothetical protein EXR57_06215 [Dehalococcoidia bacterium]|nr:hypothetical protein [Dehalococcoidia bacterium]
MDALIPSHLHFLVRCSLKRWLLAAYVAVAFLITGACTGDRLAPAPLVTPSPGETVQVTTATPEPVATAASAVGGPVPSQVPFPTSRPPTATPTPRPAGQPAIEAPRDPVVRRQEIPLPPARDVYELGRRLILKTETTPSRFTDPPPPRLKVGDAMRMWINQDNGSTQVTEVVVRVSDNAYWLFGEGIEVDQKDLDDVVLAFESVIWPRVTGTFGPIWTPGIDGDPHLLIVHARVRSGVAGYFSGADSYPRAIQKQSNEREVIYMSSNVPFGTRNYLATLAHELQHASHWNADHGEDTWINEGMAELAAEIAGYRISTPAAFLRYPATSLTEWAGNIADTGPNYGAAVLFLEYLTDHYGGEAAAGAIVAEQADGLDSVNRYLERAGYAERALDIFRDWLVANYLDDASGRYSYLRRDLHSGVRLATKFVLTPTVIEESLPPLGANYFAVSLGSQEVRLEFQGDPVAVLFPVRPASGSSCWWGNAGDSIDTTLTRKVDLRSLKAGSPASLKFSVWHDIEEDWDYGYVEVSTDGGSTWTPLPGSTTTEDNPNGNSYGPGYTGVSRPSANSGLGDWVREAVDLSAYVGREALVRFEYITDDAVHGRGMCLDDFAVPETGWADDAETPGDWTAEGFARVNDRIPQDYLVQIIRIPGNGPASVSQMPVKVDGSGAFTVSGLAPDEKLAVIVSPITAGVAGSAKYTLKVDKGG